MLVTVTADHIRRGSPGKPYSCPIALALGPGWLVGIWNAWPPLADRTDPDAVGIALPASAKAFIAAFDEGLPVEPFSFPLPDLEPATP